MTTLIERAINVNAANHQLGNEVYPLAGATFVRDTETPDIYDANHVVDPSARTPAEIDELLAAMDREYAQSGHRSFHIDHRAPPELLARLLLEGYERTDAMVMLLEGDINGEAPPCDIRPLKTDADWEAVWGLMAVDWTEHGARVGRTHEEAIGRQMWTAKKRKQPPVQYWIAYDGERAVGYFDSWEGVDGVGQVEDLFVHPDARKRGFATALVHHCVKRSRTNGSPVVIVADPTDTPKNIYARMGFRPVAIASSYLKRLKSG